MEQISDNELLERFLQNKEESAFEALVKRYGSMVIGVCHRVIQNSHDAEDAFQATFVTLAQKAEKLRHAESIRGWLYQVAVQKAMNLRSKAFRKHEQEADMDEITESTSSSKEIWGQIRSVIDEELAGLPDKLRSPILLCYLEGRTYEDAADQLGLAHSKLKGRLTKARDLLKDRLSRRGIVLSGVALAALMTENVSASPSDILVATTTKIATSSIAAVTGITGSSLLQTLLYKKAVIAALGIATLCILGILWGTLKPSVKEVVRNKPAQQQSLPLESILVETKNSISDTDQQNIESEIQLPNSVDEWVVRFDAAIQRSNKDERWKALWCLGLTLSDKDFENVESKVDLVSDSNRFQAAIFAQWGESDPISAAKWAYRFQSFSQGSSSSPFKLFPCDRNDPSQLSDTGCSIGGGDQTSLMAFIMSRWTVKDSQAAITWAQELPNSNQGRSAALRGVIRSLCLSNPQIAFSLLQSLDRNQKSCAEIEIIQRLTWKNPQEAVRWIEQLLNENPNRNYVGVFISYWSEKDFESAHGWVEKLPEGKLKEKAQDSIAQEWVKRNPQAAREWFENDKQEEIINRSGILITILQDWIGCLSSQEKFEEAGRWAQKLSNEQEREVALTYIAGEWGRKNLTAAITWAESLPAEESQKEVFNEIVTQQVRQILSGDKNESKKDKSTFLEIVSTLETLPESYREQAYQQLVSEQSGNRPEVIIEWIRSLPKEDLKDSLFSRYIGRASRHFPPSATIPWVNEIKSEYVRWSAMEHIAQEWLRTDRNAATQWVLQSSLPQETKDKLLGQK